MVVFEQAVIDTLVLGQWIEGVRETETPTQTCYKASANGLCKVSGLRLGLDISAPGLGQRCNCRYRVENGHEPLVRNLGSRAED